MGFKGFYNKHNNDRLFGIKINTPIGGFFTKAFILIPLLSLFVSFLIFGIYNSLRPPTEEEIRQKEELQLLAPYFKNFGMGCTCLEYYNKYNEKFEIASSEVKAIRYKCVEQYGNSIQLAKLQGNTKAYDKMMAMKEGQFYKRVCDYEK